MENLDLTSLIVAAVIVFAPQIIRELRIFYADFVNSRPDVGYALASAAEFGMKAAQVLKLNGKWLEDAGKQAEIYAIESAQNYLDGIKVKVDVEKVADAVRVAWLEYSTSFDE